MFQTVVQTVETPSMFSIWLRLSCCHGHGMPVFFFKEKFPKWRNKSEKKWNALADWSLPCTKLRFLSQSAWNKLYLSSNCRIISGFTLYHYHRLRFSAHSVSLTWQLNVVFDGIVDPPDSGLVPFFDWITNPRLTQSTQRQPADRNNNATMWRHCIMTY